ncbi:MAG: 5-(carboxyamino)imidazole ribonucleotide synthase [Bacteroidetes bacterium]|nr:5-(carboxyamino)imidazole ribonucleotide synthase [Bacteroidota bacterium]
MIKTIGILGGGQLGRMMAIAARTMGYNIVVLDPTPNCPCAAVADKQIVAAFDDVEAAKELLTSCDLITYEFENVNQNVANALSAKLPQTSELLRITQNRILEKQTINDAGLKTVAYKSICNRKELEVFVEDYKANVRNIIIKTVQGGYDGKGQYVIKTADELNDFVVSKYNENIEYVAEDFIHFNKEISVIVCRNASGEISIFPVAENIHKNQILHQSIVPARVSNNIIIKANDIALQLATHLNLVGTLAIEMFVCGDDVVVNELAPRPHNSGHYTLNACATNQFEQHIRAVCNLSLSDTKLFTPVVMLNVLGQDTNLMKQENMGKNKLHLYGKTEAKVDRKMGHINVLRESVDKCLIEVEKLLNFNNQ